MPSAIMGRGGKQGGWELSGDQTSEIGWLKGFNAELSPKRYWRGPRSQEVGEEGDYSKSYTVTAKMTSSLKLVQMRAILMFH